MENFYETVCIVMPDLGDEAVKGVIEKSSSVITDGGGRVIRLDDWGRRRLAYPIQKKNEGYYFVLSYASAPEASKEMERTLRLNEDVLRYQTVRLEKEPAPLEAKAEEAPAEAGAEETTTETAEAGAGQGGANE